MERVVILGGGFGGLYAAKALRNAPVSVTLIDRRNFHLFQPLLYQVATGSLSPGEISAPLRAILSKQKNARVQLGSVTDLDPEKREVILTGSPADPASEVRVPYDTLIVATGSQNSYFGHDDWESVAPGLKTIEDATAMRHKILAAFEAAEAEPDPVKRRAWLTFIVVGAGPTGVELAGALAEIANHTLREDFRSIRPEEAEITLVDSAPRVLPGYPEDLSRETERSLIRLGVRPLGGIKVSIIDADGVNVETANGPQRWPARNVLWAAGVATSPLGRVLAHRTGAPLDRAGRVIVQPDLSIPGHPEILVVGDLAYLEQDGKMLPGVAPVAMQEGRYAAKAIEARLSGNPQEPFRYWNKGTLAVIGRSAGVADLGRVHMHGRIAWLLWLFVHLMYLVEFENRLIVFIRWGIQYLTFSRGARLITGDNRTQSSQPPH